MKLVIFDVRKRQILETIKAHNMNIKSISLSPYEDFIVTGSNEGNVKVWNLPTLDNSPLYSWEDIHEKHTFVRKPGVFQAPVSTYGVMQVMLTKNYLYTCGSDGRLLRFTYHQNI